MKQKVYVFRLKTIYFLSILTTYLFTLSMKKFSTGEILKRVCFELGYTNREVADLISLSPQAVSKMFTKENVNTSTIDRLTEKLGVNIYAYLADEWNKIAEDQEGFSLKAPEGEYFRHVPKGRKEDEKPRVSVLIELDPDKQKDVMKLLNLND